MEPLGMEGPARPIDEPATPTPLGGSPSTGTAHLAPGLAYLGSAASSPHTQGGFAGAIVVRAEQLRLLPTDLPLRRAVLAEPLAVALHGVDRAGERLRGARVLVSGSGPIGALAVAALRERGASAIAASDLHEAPLAIARAVGATETYRIPERAIPEGAFDVVVECTGVLSSFRAALDAVRPGGAVIQLGIPPAADLEIPLVNIQSREIALFGAQRFANEIDEAVAVLARRPELDAVVTHTFPAADAVAAFAVAGDSAASCKVALSW